MGQGLSYFRLADPPSEPFPAAVESPHQQCQAHYRQGWVLENQWWSSKPTELDTPSAPVDPQTYIGYLDSFTDAVLSLAKSNPEDSGLAVYANQIIYHEGYFSDVRPEKHPPVNIFRLFIAFVALPHRRCQDQLDWYQLGNNIYCAFMPLDSVEDVDAFCFGAQRILAAYNLILDRRHQGDFALGFLDGFTHQLKHRIHRLCEQQASPTITRRYIELWKVAFDRLPDMYHGTRQPGLPLPELQARHRAEFDDGLLNPQ